MNRDKVMTFLKKSLRFLPDKSYIKLYYRLRVGRKLNMLLAKDVLFGVGDPQLIINNSIIKNADMVIALFGSRLGTPTARATSGTIEEIEEMIKAGKQVFVCFSEKDITITASDSEEKLRDILKVREFQKNYKGLYITYRTDEELEEKITNQLRLFVGSIEEDREIYICDVPFTYQEVRGNRPGLENAKELIFIARTGKIFLGKHYNHINQMIKNGGKITYVTSEDFNTVRDTTEYKDNQDTALTILKRLKDIYPDRVNIGFLPTPVNISMYYLKLHDGTEYINVKFNFQTYHGNDKHPMIEASTILKLWRNATGVRCHRNMMISALGFTMIILFSYLSQSKVLI